MRGAEVNDGHERKLEQEHQDGKLLMHGQTEPWYMLKVMQSWTPTKTAKARTGQPWLLFTVSTLCLHLVHLTDNFAGKMEVLSPKKRD